MADKGRAVRIPVHAGEKKRKTMRISSELSAELGREPTDEEVAERLEWTIAELLDVKEAMTETTSLNAALSGAQEDGPELAEFVEDERASEAVGEVIHEMERSFLQKAIDHLPERHRYVLIRRYGLDERSPSTLAVLSNELKVSGAVVRQLQREAEHMLKGPLLTTGEARG